MSFEAPVLLATTPVDLAGSAPLVTFTTTGGDDRDVWYRYLALRDAPVFEIGNICSSCSFFFRRLPEKAVPVDVEAVQDRLTAGLSGLDPVTVQAFAGLLQPGPYRVALFSLTPRRVAPGSGADYFTSEEPADWPDWNEEDRWDPEIPYYRVGAAGAAILEADGDRAFDFIVPLQPPEGLDPERIAYFEDRLAQGARPSAVAVSVLDIKQSYESEWPHWCLGHYLIDGHHKVEAASRTGRPLTLLSFIAVAHGISWPEQVQRRLDQYPAPVG